MAFATASTSSCSMISLHFSPKASLCLGTAQIWRRRTLRCAGLSFDTTFRMWLDADVEFEARKLQHVSTANASLLILLWERLQFTACVANFNADISRVKLS